MITLHLTRVGETEGVYLRLPASHAEIGEAFAELNAISTDTSTTKITEVISNVYNLSGYLKSIDVEKPGVLEKIGELGHRLQTMDRNECLKFEGVLDANSVTGIDDVLRLSQTLDEYTVLLDVGPDDTLGKYLVEHGFGDFPERVKPYLDHHIIGCEFYADHGGAFCRSGYVIRKDQLPEQLLEQEPECNGKWLMLLKLRAKGDVRKTTDLVLPATEASLDSARQRLGIDEFAEADILLVDYTMPYLSQMIPQDCVAVEDANELALAIEEMRQEDSEVLKFLSVLEVEHPDTFQEACRLALDLDDYERVPADAEEYGQEVLRRIGADNELLNTIDGYMDFAALGSAAMQEDGVVNTRFGMVRRLSEPFTEQSLGMRME